MASQGPIAGVDYPIPSAFQTPGQTPEAPLSRLYAGNLYYVKKTTDADYNAFFALHNQLYADGTTSVQNSISAAYTAMTSARGDIMFICDGNWGENVVINKQIKIMGAGKDRTYIKPNDATTKITVTPLGESQLTAVGFVVLARGVEMSNFSIQVGSTTQGGIYIGDGGRVNSLSLGNTANPHEVLIHDIHFDGNGVGAWAVMLDGMGPGTHIYANDFDNWWGAGAVHFGSGTGKDQVGAKIHHNFFSGCRGNVVKRASASVSYANVVGPGNVFMDGTTTPATLQVLFNANGGQPDGICGNHFLGTNTFTATASDWQSGNYKNVAGNTNSYVQQAA